MNNCEIVDNVACGVSFQYCRTHKVEPKDCPGNAKPVAPQSQAQALYQYQVEINRVASAPDSKREFRVGDKIRALASSAGYSVRAGEEYYVTGVYQAKDGLRVSFNNPRAIGGTDGWLAKNFELVSE